MAALLVKKLKNILSKLKLKVLETRFIGVAQIRLNPQQVSKNPLNNKKWGGSSEKFSGGGVNKVH